MKHYALICFSLLFLCVQPCFASAAEPKAVMLPSFSGTSMDGQDIDMSQYIGKNPIVLVFWTSWCPSCKGEVPKINALVDQFEKKGMKFVGINIGVNDSEKRASSFMESTKMNYPVIFDIKQEITTQYGIRGVPTIVVADSKGAVQFVNHFAPGITEADFKKLSGDE